MAKIYRFEQADLQLRVQKTNGIAWQIDVYAASDNRQLLLHGPVVRDQESKHGLVTVEYGTVQPRSIQPERLQHSLSLFVYLGALAAQSDRHQVGVDPVHPRDDNEQDPIMADVLKKFGLKPEKFDNHLYAAAGAMKRKFAHTLPRSFVLP